MNNINIKQLENRLIHSSKSKNNSKDIKQNNFKSIFEKVQQKDEEIKFSKHARTRMDIRDMELNSEEVERLKSGFAKAEEKGVEDALILIGDKAFITSIKNKTVITTVNKEQLKNNVFTNIDGAVIV